MKKYLVLATAIVMHTHLASEARAADISQFRFIPLTIDQVLSDAHERRVVSGSDIQQGCDVLGLRSEARVLLEPIALRLGDDSYRYTERRAGSLVTFRDPEKTIALAMMDPQTCALSSTVITKRGNQLITPTDVALEAVTRSNGIQWNNWATEFRVLRPDQAVVIMVKYPYAREERIARVITTSAKKRRTVYDTTRVVVPVYYTPYSRELHVPSLVAQGRRYLDELARAAYEELRMQRVPSLAQPSNLVADVAELRPEYVSRLAPIEHMDLTEFLLDPSWTTDRIHIVFGVNGNDSATFTCSKASACGLMQFTRGTYDFIRKLYPQAQLIATFDAGARDQFNAMKAAILLHDYNSSQLVSAFSPDILRDPYLEEYLAAGYNTGIGRVISVITAARTKKITDWTDGKGARKGSGLLAETKGYIAKLRFVRDQWQTVPLAQDTSTSPNN